MKVRAAILTCAVATAACADDSRVDGETASSPTLDSAIATMTGDSVADTAGTAAAGGARAVMRDAAGRELGTVTLSDGAGGIQLAGGLSGLPPGEHGIHVHAVGQCEPPFTSAGPHWNPTSRQHGTQNPQGPHFGDLPNLVVDAGGLGTVSGTTAGGSLSGEQPALDADGAAVVVHAGPDDHRTDPSGNSGDRIACGVIERA